MTDGTRIHVDQGRGNTNACGVRGPAPGSGVNWGPYDGGLKCCPVGDGGGAVRAKVCKCKCNRAFRDRLK
jgi:hypothetical protein